MKPGDMIIMPGRPDYGYGLLLEVVKHPEKKKSRWALVPATYTVFWTVGITSQHISENVTIRRVSMIDAQKDTQGYLLCK